MDNTIKITTIKELTDLIEHMDENTMLTVTFKKQQGSKLYSFRNKPEVKRI